jgi:hypothetical protein
MQSRRLSLIEAITNVVVGYALAVATQMVVFPWFDLNPSLGENLALGLVFTAISLIRGYALRATQTVHAVRSQMKKDQPKLVLS